MRPTNKFLYSIEAHLPDRFLYLADFIFRLRWWFDIIVSPYDHMNSWQFFRDLSDEYIFVNSPWADFLIDQRAKRREELKTLDSEYIDCLDKVEDLNEKLNRKYYD